MGYKSASQRKAVHASKNDAKKKKTTKKKSQISLTYTKPLEVMVL